MSRPLVMCFGTKSIDPFLMTFGLHPGGALLVNVTRGFCFLQLAYLRNCPWSFICVKLTEKSIKMSGMPPKQSEKLNLGQIIVILTL